MAWISNSDYRSENERVFTQLTTLLLEWGDEWARETVHGSSSTAIIRMLPEWDAVNDRTYRQRSHGNYQSAS